MSVAGQNSRYNSITVDGVAINDTFGLESNGSPTARQPISIEAIQSVQVNVANYDVTQKGYTGANINAVTKSGTNTWKGGVYYVYRDDRLVGQRYNNITDTYSDAPKFKEDHQGYLGQRRADRRQALHLRPDRKIEEHPCGAGLRHRRFERRHHRPDHRVGHRQRAADRQGCYGINIGGLTCRRRRRWNRKRSCSSSTGTSTTITARTSVTARPPRANRSIPFFSATGVTLDSTYYSNEQEHRDRPLPRSSRTGPRPSRPKSRISMRDYDASSRKQLAPAIDRP